MNELFTSWGSHNFVCKKWKPGHEPTHAPPTDIPPGHCHDDETGKLVEFQGYCYKFVNLQEGFSWDAGKGKCEELGEGYHMASFHSERESSFVYTMLSQLDGPQRGTEFWIGANDRDEEGTWANEDGTPFDYSHWAWGEPNGSTDVCQMFHYL